MSDYDFDSVMARLTDKAKNVLQHAGNIARDMQCDFIGTEHLFLGITREKENVGAQVLKGLGIQHERAKAEVERMISPPLDILSKIDPKDPDREVSLTVSAKRLISIAGFEANKMDSNDIGPEHLLLAICVDITCTAALVLESIGIDCNSIYRKVFENLGHKPVDLDGLDSTEEDQDWPRNRPETGAMEFGDDYRGIFVRGDNALGIMSDLQIALHVDGKNVSDSTKRTIEYLIELFAESYQHGNAKTQIMNPFKDCFIEDKSADSS